MTTLHIVNRSPSSHAALNDCLQYVQDDSAVLLIEDAVYAGVDNAALQPHIDLAKQSCKLYALRPDLVARGLLGSRVLKKVVLVDYPEFVELVTEYDVVQTWS